MSRLPCVWIAAALLSLPACERTSLEPFPDETPKEFLHGPTATPERTNVAFPSAISVDIHGANAKHESTRVAFAAPVSFRNKRLTVTVQVPDDFVKRPFSSICLWAKDAQLRWQNTTWADGSLSPENPAFNPADRTLTLSYVPTAPDVSKQGWTVEGFSPEAGIREVGIKIATPSAAGKDYALTGTVKVLDAAMASGQAPPMERAVLKPLLRKDAGRPDAPPQPLGPAQVKSGVSRFFRYDDLHRWAEVEPEVARVFRAQQQEGLFSFRLMGGLDIRGASGGLRLGRAEFHAMERYLALAKETGQRHHIFTLFDGAVPNDTLQLAMTDPNAQRAFIDALRPFILRFGTATIQGEPLIFDLVNEIHEMGGVTERQRQRFVEALIEAFIHEAPGATVTIGVRDWRELAYWLYLPERFTGQPVRLLFTVHCYGEALNELPAAWTLNLPDGAEIGITEADPTADLTTQLRLAAEKGYHWLLFWVDADHPYDPAAHRQAIEQASGR